MTNRISSILASRRLRRGSLPALLTLSGLLAANAAEAQQCPPGKTCYYVPPILPFPAIEPLDYGGDFVFHAIGTNVTGTYSTNGGAPVPFTAIGGVPLVVPISGIEGRMSGFLVSENRGTFVVSDSPGLLVEQRIVASSWQASATIKSKVVGLGTRFRAGGYALNSPANGDDTGYDFLAFYAPTATTVTVTAPPGSVAPFWNDGVPGLTHTFAIGAGQTYALRTQLGVDIDGALITSTDPISVITGGRGWFSGCGDEGRDNLVPTNLLGTQFVVDDYPAILAERLRVVADTDNTQVSINGAVAATINAGEFYQPAITGVTFIETSQPAYVFQNAGHVQCELDVAMIPPIVFAPLASTSASLNLKGIGSVIIYMPSAAVGSLQFDGGALPSPQISSVPTHPEYSRVRFDILEGDHLVTAASDFQIGMVSFAPGATGVFGYFNPYRVSTCGNSALNPGESCDDGNFDDGDGCSSTCEVEDGYVCTGEPSVCTLDPCLAVVCIPLDDCHDAGVCDSLTGLCSDPEKINGSACDDGNACTQTDSCQSGVCTAGVPVTCATPDQCHDAGVCNPTTGVCSNPTKPDGSACNDTDACTQTDSCQAGSCTGGNPVTCTALDQCHDVGTCDSASGACSNPNKTDGTTCDDSNACTQTDACQAGSCTGGNPVTCTAIDQCHDVGTCDTATGACSNPNKADGTTCNDSNACTQTDACQAGSCTGGNPVTCTAIDQCHDVGTCDTATGACSNPNKADGTTCNDSNACTQTDACQAGSCTGGNPVTCTAIDQCHDVGTCDTATGACSNPNKPNGTTCNDSDACTQTDACQAGSCTGGNPVTCTAIDQCHDVGTCDSASGVCSNPNKPNGTTCNDSDACTQTDVCQAGSCTGDNPVKCAALDQCHDIGTCSPTTGVCSNPNKADGSSCNDTNGCTQTDTCVAGSCTGGNPVTCTPLDQCHDVGTCDSATGACSNPSKADGSSCNDSNACTQSDACFAGSCTGTNPVTCTPLDQCHDVGTCDAVTGACSNPNKADGSACSDPDACTQGDTCQAGTCSGGTPFVCVPTACQTSSTCDNKGGCIVVNKPLGEPCPDDGNLCTTDACDGAGSCVQFLATDGTPCDSGKICTGGLCGPGCFIEGTLYLENTLNPSNRCQLCNPSVSTTDWSNQVDGLECDNGDACTADDICQAGECVGIPVICTAEDQCHDDGVCDPLVGACVNPPKADGTECDDENACTQTDVCTAGTCTGGMPIECVPTDECHDVGLCDPLSGICSDPTKEDGTPCETGACKVGICEPSSSSSSGTGGGGGSGGSNELEPLVGRGGGCLCTAAGDEVPAPGRFALFGLAIVSLMRRMKRSKK